MKTKIGFIGAGNIVQAILKGVKKEKGYPPAEIGIFDVSQAVRNSYQENGYCVFESIKELVVNTNIVVVAVTPQVIDTITSDIKEALSDNNIILSLTAGVSINWFQEQLGSSCKVVRCMPTLTAQVGLGAYAVSYSHLDSDREYIEIKKFLKTTGIVEMISESLMCEVVPFTGSAPMYFYHMAKVIVKEAIDLGFDENTALQLFAQTMKGSAEMLLNSDISPDELEEKLRLPGGTTMALLDKMDELNFDNCLTESIKACVIRCKELGSL